MVFNLKYDYTQFFCYATSKATNHKKLTQKTCLY